MLAGVAVASAELPAELVEACGLRRRVHTRGGEPEVRFLLAEADRLLPVWLGGRLRVVRWGNRRGQCPRLPLTAWARTDAQGWGDREPEPVVIPANAALDNGVWYGVREGVRGVAVRDDRGLPVAYPLVERSSHYYRVMTKSPWMPALVGELI